MLHCHHQNDSCIKMGCGVSHLNDSFMVWDKVCVIDKCVKMYARVCIQSLQCLLSTRHLGRMNALGYMRMHVIKYV